MKHSTPEHKELIVWLILQDLKHRRLTCGACGQPVTELKELSILNIIVKLMGIDTHRNKARTSEALVKAYYEFLDKSGEELEPLAENIYLLMSGCVALEKKRFEFKKLIAWMTGRKTSWPK